MDKPQRITQGPVSGQQSLYRQRVLAEGTYTNALAHIIQRDFFPRLRDLRAENEYLAALAENDPDALAAAVRKLAALSRDSHAALHAERARRTAQFAFAATPHINVPTVAERTPVGARGWDTPLARDTEPGPSRHRKHQQSARRTRPLVRDDLTLDAFQLNYTSEDNASFVQIVDQDNRRRREQTFGWAFDAEKNAEDRRLQGEAKRKLLLDTAISGHWKVNADGKRLTGALSEGGTDRPDGEAWKYRLIADAVPSSSDQQHDENQTEQSAIVPHTSSTTSTSLIKHHEPSTSRPLTEIPLPPKHPLAEALSTAGLPATALISAKDGKIVPHREHASGTGQERGRDDHARIENEKRERQVMGEEREESLSLAGSGVDLWKYKARNNLMYPPDADTNPYPKHAANHTVPSGPRPGISHDNTRLPDQDPEWPLQPGSTRATSPSRSLVDAAVKGLAYRPDHAMPKVNNYPLLPNDPSPSPDDMPSLLTWGSLLATPRALDANGDPLDKTPSYRLPDVKRREELGRKLADKASRSMSDRAKGFAPRPTGSIFGSKKHSFGNMGPPATPRRQADGLTPAAKRLLERTVGRTPITQNRNLPGSSDFAGRTSKRTMHDGWTPTPKRSK